LNKTQKLCKNNYLEFLNSLASVGHFKEGIRVIRRDLIDVNKSLEALDRDHLQKAVKVLDQRQNYVAALDTVHQLSAVKVSIFP